MRKIIFITGGQRSGKSNYARLLAESWSDCPVYLATARIWDADFQQRVLRHQADRDDRWTTLEEEKLISRHDLTGKTVLLDCITLWLTNIYYDNHYDPDLSLREAKEEWNRFVKQDFQLIVVTNELGMGVHAVDEGARKFADLQGWMNQHIAAMADQAYLMVSGIPLRIK